MKKLLLIEDDPIMGESLNQRFEIEGYLVRWCRSIGEAKEQDILDFSIVISDVRLPDGFSTNWFVNLPAAVRTIPWIFLTGYGSVNDALLATRAGAREYLTKPFDVEQLVEKVQQNVFLADQITDDAVLGISPAMRRVEATARKVSQQRIAVLISGESGVGKEITAQYIHSQDTRTKKGEFIAVNCAAIPENLMESEFFGYEKGAFSGAQRLHHGYLERANHGTLFLDEIGELAPSMQAKLLRALQEKCFYRLGAERTTQSDFRIISATNRDLVAAMEAGNFREDLFYRIAVIRIDLLPLRDRPEDIRWLTEKILGQITIEHKQPIAMSEDFLRDLLSRQWRGNIRELRSYLEQAAIMSDGGILDEPLLNKSNNTNTKIALTEKILTLQNMVENAERLHIRKSLVHCEGSVSKTAELLGISRKTLWGKMKKLSITA
jgi:DNA-binding NtrC family response regulator